MLIPKKVKHRKWHKGRARNIRKATDKIEVSFGSFGLKATSPAKRGGKIWIRIFPDKPITKKGNEVPMGSGKGAVDHYVAPVKIGTVMFEMDGIPEASAKEALLLAGYKLPCTVKYVSNTLI